MHNVYFVQFDAPVSDSWYNQKKGGYRGIFREAGEDTGTYFREITDLEFQNHKNVKKNVLSAHSNKLGQIYVQWDAKLKF